MCCHEICEGRILPFVNVFASQLGDKFSDSNRSGKWWLSVITWGRENDLAAGASRIAKLLGVLRAQLMRWFLVAMAQLDLKIAIVSQDVLQATSCVGSPCWRLCTNVVQVACT